MESCIQIGPSFRSKLLRLYHFLSSCLLFSCLVLTLRARRLGTFFIPLRTDTGTFSYQPRHPTTAVRPLHFIWSPYRYISFIIIHSYFFFRGWLSFCLSLLSGIFFLQGLMVVFFVFVFYTAYSFTGAKHSICSTRLISRPIFIHLKWNWNVVLGMGKESEMVIGYL